MKEGLVLIKKIDQFYSVWATLLDPLVPRIHRKPKKKTRYTNGDIHWENNDDARIRGTKKAKRSKICDW